MNDLIDEAHARIISKAMEKILARYEFGIDEEFNLIPITHSILDIHQTPCGVLINLETQKANKDAAKIVSEICGELVRVGVIRSENLKQIHFSKKKGTKETAEVFVLKV